MGVRLNKVLSELNIGFETAVEFLKKKTNLGEIKDDATPNTKISDGQYEALVNEFNTDKAVKTKAEQLFTKKVKEKKVEKPEQKEKAALLQTNCWSIVRSSRLWARLTWTALASPRLSPSPSKSLNQSPSRSLNQSPSRSLNENQSLHLWKLPSHRHQSLK